MNHEKWEKISAMIEEKFEIEEHGQEDLDPGISEFYIFEGPIGRMKIECITKPKVIDRKVHGSKRVGGESVEERIYSKDEQTSFIKAHIWNDDVDSWSDMDISDLI